MNRVFKIMLCAVLAVSLSVSLTGCSNLPKDTKEDDVKLDLDGVSKHYKILIVNDTHIQINNDEVAESNRDYMEHRIGEFTTRGLTTKERWDKLSSSLDSYNADLIVFAGDMVDFCSKANTEALKEGFDKLKTPYIYIRSDHDTEPYWMTDGDDSSAKERQDKVTVNTDVLYADLGELCVLCINNSNRQISKEMLETMKPIFEKGKPVLVVTHIPIEQEEGTELLEYSEEVRDGRHLYWGYTGEAYPDNNTAEFMSILYSEESNVKAVFAAHLHAKWEGQLSENAIEHVFAPAFQGNVGVVEVY